MCQQNPLRPQSDATLRTPRSPRLHLLPSPSTRPRASAAVSFWSSLVAGRCGTAGDHCVRPAPDPVVPQHEPSERRGREPRQAMPVTRSERVDCPTPTRSVNEGVDRLHPSFTLRVGVYGTLAVSVWSPRVATRRTRTLDPLSFVSNVGGFSICRDAVCGMFGVLSGQCVIAFWTVRVLHEEQHFLRVALI